MLKQLTSHLPFAVAVVLAVAGDAAGAHYDSVADGDWSSVATWGGGPPGDGDTVSIGHSVTVDVDVTVGDSPASDSSFGVSVAAGGNLVIADGVTLTAKTNVQLVGDGDSASTFLMGAGSALVFDGSAASNQQYQLEGEGDVSVSMAGVSGSPCSIAGASADARGRINVDRQSTGGVMAAVHCDFEYLGSAVTAGGDDEAAGNGVLLATTSSATVAIAVTNCSFSDVYSTLIQHDGSAGALSVTGNTWSGSTEDVYIGGQATSEEAQVVSANTVDTRLAVLPSTNLTISDCYLGLGVRTAERIGSGNEYAGCSITDCTLRQEAGSPSVWIGDMQGCYSTVVGDGTTPLEPHHIVLKSSSEERTIKECVFEYNGGYTGTTPIIGACLVADGDGVGAVVQNNLMLPDGNANIDTSLVLMHSSFATPMTVNHNTGSVEGSAMSAYGTYSALDSGALLLLDNLAWASAAGLKAQRVSTFADVDPIATLSDYNVGWGLSAGTAGRGYDRGPSSDPVWTLGSAADVGVDDNGVGLDGDPSFSDSARTLATWGQDQHSTDGSVSAALTVLSGSPSESSNLVSWLREGHMATSSSLSGAGSDGYNIGIFVDTGEPAGGGRSKIIGGGLLSALCLSGLLISMLLIPEPVCCRMRRRRRGGRPANDQFNAETVQGFGAIEDRRNTIDDSQVPDPDSIPGPAGPSYRGQRSRHRHGR